MFDPKKYHEANGGSNAKFTRTSSQICAPPEEELLEAVLSNNILKIRQIIQKNEYLLCFTYPDYNKRILLIACSEDGVKAETVQTLLSLKANPRDHNEDDGWEALHLAACKTDFDILDVLLKNNPGDVNVTDRLGSNALHILIRYGNRESPEFLKCAELLVKKGIDVNCEDSKNKTPLYWANKKGCSDEINSIIENQNLFKRNVSPQMGNNNLEVEDQGKVLMKYLKQGNENEFVNFKNGFIDDLVDYCDETNTLLQFCCKRGLNEAAIYLINKGADVKRTTNKNADEPIEIAAENGFSEIFKALLTKYNPISKIPDGLLGTILRYIDRERHGNIGCYQALMDRLKGGDPDEVSLLLNQRDNVGNTPLHYAIRYADTDVIEELLSLGASLGARNKYGVMPIQDIEPETLEKHLDKCVVFDLKSKHMDKEDFQVKFNYRSIIPPYAKSGYNETNSFKDLEAAGINSTVEKELVAETEVIFFMSKALEYKHLLKHPVIVSFLFMKWLRIQWLFWANLAFYVTFALSLVVYIFTEFAYFSTEDRSSIHTVFVHLSFALLVVTLVVLMLRELFQMCVAPIKYFRNFENYMEILLIVLTGMIVFMKSPSPETRKQLSSLAILLAAFDLVLMLGNHPYFSTNVVMLRTVSFNFFKFLVWYSLLIIAFALSFYLLFTTHTLKSMDIGNNTAMAVTKNETDDDGNEDKSFDNPARSVFKTIIMLTGEFDASDLNFDTFPITSKLIFALFIFMIAIILLNLLNGLAVSDTQMIRNDAELVGHIARAQHIRHVESMLVGNILPVNLMNKLGDICCCLPFTDSWNYRMGQSLARNASLFPKYLNYELTFYPNKCGLVDSNTLEKNMSTKKSCAACSAIYLDRDTVRRTNSIVQATKDERLKNDESYIRKIENDLESLKMKMDLILKLLNPVEEN